MWENFTTLVCVLREIPGWAWKHELVFIYKFQIMQCFERPQRYFANLSVSRKRCATAVHNGIIRIMMESRICHILTTDYSHKCGPSTEPCGTPLGTDIMSEHTPLYLMHMTHMTFLIDPKSGGQKKVSMTHAGNQTGSRSFCLEAAILGELQGSMNS